MLKCHTSTNRKNESIFANCSVDYVVEVSHRSQLIPQVDDRLAMPQREPSRVLAPTE